MLILYHSTETMQQYLVEVYSDKVTAAVAGKVVASL